MWIKSWILKIVSILNNIRIVTKIYFLTQSWSW